MLHSWLIAKASAVVRGSAAPQALGRCCISICSSYGPHIDSSMHTALVIHVQAPLVHDGQLPTAQTPRHRTAKEVQRSHTVHHRGQCGES